MNDIRRKNLLWLIPCLTLLLAACGGRELSIGEAEKAIGQGKPEIDITATYYFVRAVVDGKLRIGLKYAIRAADGRLIVGNWVPNSVVTLQKSATSVLPRLGARLSGSAVVKLLAAIWPYVVLAAVAVAVVQALDWALEASLGAPEPADWNTDPHGAYGGSYGYNGY